MAFEESPQFDGNEVVTRFSFRGWMARNRILLTILAIAFFLLDAALAGYFLFPAVFRGAPGGLDGCLVTESGDPLSATVQVADQTRHTNPEGCFVFPALLPGSWQVTIQTGRGEPSTQTVKIISEQAVSLGQITLP